MKAPQLSSFYSFFILNQQCIVCLLLLIALPFSISFLWSYDDNHIFEQSFWKSHELVSHLFSMRASLGRLNASSRCWDFAYDDCLVVLLAALAFLLVLALILSLIEDHIGLIKSTIYPRFRLHFLKPWLRQWCSLTWSYWFFWSFWFLWSYWFFVEVLWFFEVTDFCWATVMKLLIFIEVLW